MSEADAVTIIIVTHNSLPALMDCLETIPAAAGGLPWQLVIIDNASVDNSADEAVRSVPTATVVRNSRNVGFAVACNQGARDATGDWLLFLNPDTRLDPGSISTLVTSMTSIPKVGMATMRLRNPDGSFQPNCRNFPTMTNLLFSRGSIIGRLLWNRLNPRAPVYTLPDYAEDTEVPAVSATAVMIQRELFRLMRGFDTRYYMYMEDTDLAYRLHLHGYANLFVPQAGAVHRWGKGSAAGRMRRAWYHHQSVWRYFLKYQPNGFSLIVLPAILLVNFLLVVLIPAKGK